MNLVQKIKEAKGLEKIKLLKEFKALSGLEKIKALKDFKGSGTPNLQTALETIKEALEANTQEALESIENEINLIEANEDKLEDSILFKEVIELFEDLADGGVIQDSIGGRDLFDVVTLDSATKADAEKVEKFVMKRVPSGMIKNTEIHFSRGKLFIEYNDKLTDHQRSMFELSIGNGVKKVGGKLEYTEVNHNHHQWEVLMDSVVLDAIKKERTFQTYSAWKRAVRQLDPKAKFDGDKDINFAFKKGEYDAEWDGESGEIRFFGEK